MWDFKWLYLKKYSLYEKIINMKNHKYEKCSKSSKLFEKIISRQIFLDLTNKRKTVYFSCKNTKFYGLTSKSKGFCRKHLGHDISLENETLWSKDKKYGFWYRFWHLRTILSKMEFFHVFYLKCDHYSRFQDFSKYTWYAQIWCLNTYLSCFESLKHITIQSYPYGRQSRGPLEGATFRNNTL